MDPCVQTQHSTVSSLWLCKTEAQHAQDSATQREAFGGSHRLVVLGRPYAAFMSSAVRTPGFAPACALPAPVLAPLKSPALCPSSSSDHRCCPPTASSRSFTQEWVISLLTRLQTVHSTGPGLWLQTGLCMPYGLWLRVAIHIYITHLSKLL